MLKNKKKLTSSTILTKEYFDKKFVTKEYFDKQFKKLDKKFVTKKYLDKTLDKKLDQKLDEKLQNYATKDQFNEVINILDKVMGELKAIRQEMALMFGRQRINTDTLESHEFRINNLEKIPNIQYTN